MMRYETYKDTEMDWLGKIPATWNVERIKNIGSVNGRVGWKALKAAEYVESGFFFLSTPNIKDVEIDFVNVNYITAERYYESPEIMLEVGDILLVKDGSTLGIVNVIRYLPAKGTVNSSIAVLRIKKFHAVYGYYFLLSNYIQNVIQLKKDGMGVPHLFQKDINNFEILVPSSQEQTTIANYLDTKTQAIDKKISLLDKKIGYYQELRKSLINETVTKGLDKNVKLKESGIDWMGQIPEHWEVRRLKDVGRLVLGKMLNTSSQINYELKPYLKSKNINWLYVDTDEVEEMYFNKNELVRYKIKKGDLLFSEGGEVGKTCIWNDEICECYIQNSVHKFTAFSGHDSRYLMYHSFCLGASNYYDGIVNQVSIKHLTWEKLNIVLFIIPPLPEQTQIADYLAEKISKIDQIIANIQTQIITLKELRKTLINDVVTGKIKVIQN